MAASNELDYEVVVIGAGVAGIYQIRRLADLGVNATVLESAPDLGDTTTHTCAQVIASTSMLRQG